MNKILLVTIDFWPRIGGVANYYLNLCQHLKDRVVVLTNGAGPGTEIDKYQDLINFKLYRRKILLDFLRPKWLLMFIHIYRLLNLKSMQLDYGGRISQLWVGEILPTGTVVWLLSKLGLIDKPYMVSCHGMDLLQAAKFKRKKKLAGYILRDAELVLVNSYFTAKLVKDYGVEEGKVKVIYPAINPELPKVGNKKQEIISKYGLKNKKIILSLSRLVDRKGFSKVIEAMPNVLAEIPEAVYIIAGSGPDLRTIKQAKGKLDQRWQKNIIIYGMVDEQEKATLYELCDVFAMPAKYDDRDVEGFGIVYLEAALAGKPVVASKSGGAPEAVLDGKTGLLVEAENVEEIAGAIKKLLTHQVYADELGSYARQRVLRDFDWAKRAKQFEEVVGKVS